MADLDKNKSYPVVAIRDIVAFPGTVLPLYVGRKTSLNAVKDALKTNGVLICLTQKDAEVEDVEPKDLYQFGTIIRVLQAVKMPDGTMKVLVEGLTRAKVTECGRSKDGTLIYAMAQEVNEPKVDPKEAESLLRMMQEKFGDYLKSSDHLTLEIIANLTTVTSVSDYADLICAHLPMGVESKQAILETIPIDQRVKKILTALEQELQWQNKEKDMLDKVRDEINEDQQSYFIRKKMKVYEDELRKMGDDGLSGDLESYESRIKKLDITEDAKNKLFSEAAKLKYMPEMTAEATVVRNYLDAVLNIPWGQNAEINDDLASAQKILDKQHYGLKKVKERIVEALAVSLRVSRVKAPILCLVGPPGVGKTSLGESIAEAMGRPFVRIALGGMRDESEIRGHRRTYVGAMPGQLIRVLSRAKKMNALVMLDEVDKMGMDFRGDPASALLEVLDPEQNDSFVDHYVELEVDLSGILFITTANTLEIPSALLDRMEVIELSGYTEEEKLNIAKKYLVKKCMLGNGLAKKDIIFQDESLTKIIRSYTREAGVRELERCISKICRKVVKQIHMAKRKPSAAKTIKPTDLAKFLDASHYEHLDIGKKAKVGVVNGLAWTESGGELLNIEALSIPGKGELVYTGSLGEVMQESIRAAHSVVRSSAKRYKIKEDTFSECDFHVHVPQGATPKDGPSAGIGMATALLSVATQKKVRNDVAMTGELTLTGEVLPIGGLKEKMLAAIRSGAKEVIIPKGNKKDLVEFKKDIDGKIEVHMVSEITEVFQHAFVNK